MLLIFSVLSVLLSPKAWKNSFVKFNEVKHSKFKCSKLAVILSNLYKLSTNSTEAIDPQLFKSNVVKRGEKLKLQTIEANPFSVAKTLLDKSTYVNYFALINPSVISLEILVLLIDPFRLICSKCLALVNIAPTDLAALLQLNNSVCSIDKDFNYSSNSFKEPKIHSVISAYDPLKDNLW